MDLIYTSRGTFIEDPDSGALYPAISGAQEDFSVDDSSLSFDPSLGTSDASAYDTAQNFTSPFIQAQPNASTEWSSLYGGNPTPQSSGSPLGGAGGSQGLIPGVGGSLGGLNSPQGLLGLLGGGASLLGTLASGGVTGTQRPTLPTAQKAMIGEANQALQPGALGQLPLQQQQAAILQQLGSGQIPPGYASLVANAYDPAYQNAATRSIQAGQQAGFYDNPLSSPVGGNIMGPAAAQLQGQQANSLLNLLTQIPGLYQGPINAQLGAAGSQANALLGGGQQYAGQQNSVPLAGQLGQQVGGALTGVSQGIGQANQQQFQNQLLQQLVAQQGGGGIGPGGAQNVSPQATGSQNLFQNQGVGSQMPNTGSPPPQSGPDQGTTGSYYAQGGIVDKPTQGVVGEAGPEAIVPLKGLPPQIIGLLQALIASQKSQGVPGQAPAGLGRGMTPQMLMALLGSRGGPARG